ncbi:anti-sigma B factor antagonist [Amycolatopsis bartoniae]|uniref:Anti-sigma factor antagonist n=1 Tax=Amycolatopsis bartoniae TaxID=941986 RepID=A0A8H9IYM7_9PSEU|nr:STAS domain-containing protein [Amycolatopsis bartoniae]MBB2934396.1 anti-sigma B factor antagonist [Amycolatopsis bartoniae]TVT02933.1 STAS domain-containing protein [Amycolatopsis bartoniae]GHF47650.1 anti-sigma factor antagonist [Amycolatopsis bartoniae]
MSATAIPPLLHITTNTPEPGVVVVDVRGEVDASSVPDLATALEKVWAAAPGRVVVDLSRVTFLGTAGLSALLDARERAEADDFVLRLVGGSRCVDRAVEVAGLAPHLPLSPDLGHALRG